MTAQDGKGDARRGAYQAAGVDVAAGDRAVDLMRAHVESTRRPEVAGGLGGFGGAIGIPAGYREPLLVASTDGVGTKTAIAAALGRFDTIGIDLVAMCADDVVCCGAEPLAFLDYVAVGQVVPEWVGELVGSVAAGCRDAGCALIGGETAEHPGLMEPDEFDLSGCCIGVVERADVIDGSAIRAGDTIVGLTASGLHSNGFSLVRTLIAQWDLDLAEPYQARLRRIARRRRGRCGRGGGAQRGDGHPGRDPADPDPDLCAVRAGRPGRAPVGRPRRPRHRPHHRWRPARQRPARAARRAGGSPRPEPLADAVGHAPVRGARRARRRGAAGHLQRRPRDGHGRAAGGRGDGHRCDPPSKGSRRSWSAR